MNNRFFVKSKKLNGCFCGRCGNRSESVPYQNMLYCEYCGRRQEVIEENETLAYCFRAEERGLVLYILTPGLVMSGEARDGLSKQRVRISDYSDRSERWRYIGFQWKKCGALIFRPGTKEVLAEGEELKDCDLDALADEIDKGAYKRAVSGTDLAEIRKVFPGILDVYSIRMFVHIFRQKGYRFDMQVPEDAAAKLLSEKLCVEDYRISPARYLAEQIFAGRLETAGAAPAASGVGTAEVPAAKGAGSVKKVCEAEVPAAGENTALEEAARFYEELGMAAEQFESSSPELDSVNSDKQEYTFRATLHRIPAEDKEQERYFLRIAVREEKGYRVFLFSRNYAACSRSVKLKDVFQKSLFPAGDSLQAIRAYDRIYPGAHLMQYMKGSYNVLVPLLSADYHTGVELAAKAGAAGVAENFFKLEYAEWEPSRFRNIKEMTGLPISLLRKIPASLASGPNLNLLVRLMQTRPEYVQLNRITSTLFYRMYSDYFIRRFRLQREKCEKYGRMSKEETDNCKVLHCLTKHLSDTDLYFDYIRICERLNQYVYGIEPSIRIRKAHDEAYKILERNEILKILNRSGVTRREFSSAVADPAYLDLTTCRTEKDKAFFAADPYEIIAPKTIGDLLHEGQEMHNCVSTYARRVMQKTCRIYFLRKKDDPDKSFGTIEVCGEQLRQAKGFGNSSLKSEAQLFVRKWCTYKKLTIATADLYETA